MKHYPLWIVLAIAILWLASNSRLPKTTPGDFDFIAFGKIPVLADGRIKPLDTVGRTTLLIIHGKQSLRLKDGPVIDSTHWLTDVLFNAPAADQYPVFAIYNPEVLGLFGWEQNDRKYFSYAELNSFMEKIDEQGQKVEVIESAKRTSFQTAIFNLRNSLLIYERLKNSLRPESAQDFNAEIETYLAAIPSGLAEMAKQKKGEKIDRKELEEFARFTGRYQEMAALAYVLPVPPQSTNSVRREEWNSIGASLLGTLSVGSIDPVTKAYAFIGDAYHGGDAALFNQQVNDLTSWMAKNEPRAANRSAFEYVFNQLAPFYQAMGLYVLAFLVICCSWLFGNRSLNKAAFYLLLIALAVHTFGLGARMILQGRPPVTNLYSSAIFIGWGTVILGLILEKIFRDGIGSACAAVIGFITLIIAHHLAGSGDTLEMLQAVLDTNIWLATHVVCITIGYSAMFFAGTLAAFYVVRGVFTSSLTKESAQSLFRMTYGVVCFATLFSFVGTVLGGIWADQSWGRFWGWDPKENGALMIVLWCALTLHARMGGYIRQRGFIVMALFGNIITSFSWFGVNMLGVGLHSYGFMSKALPWLIGFILSQLVLMAIALLPLSRWRSSQAFR